MIAGRRYVICGLSRLTTRVAQALEERGAEVVVIHDGHQEDLVSLLGRGLEIIRLSTSRHEALSAAGLADAACLLALDEDDLANLKTAVAAHQVAPNVPVVLRTFAPALADQMEQGLNVRRAYSVSALSAPAFVAAALAEEGVETLRLGDAEVSICRLTVRAGSPLLGKSPRELKRQFGCGVLAHAGRDGDWRPCVGDAERLETAEQVLVCGLLSDVLGMARLNSPIFERNRQRTRPRRDRRRGVRRSRPTLLPSMALSLLLILVLAVLVFATALDLHPVDALYFVVTTATTTGYGDISLRDSSPWLKMFGCLVMLSGGALLAILFSYLAAVATAERLEEQMGRQARRLCNHVIVAGLGNIGYRVLQLLHSLGIASVAVERSPGARFAEAIRAHSVVLTGDARLAEDLERASIRTAAALVACTDDDLANIQSCLHARRLNPGIRTVARVFDDHLAAHLTATYQIDAAISTTRAAAGAFVGAATGERAIRAFEVGGRSFLAFRLDVGAPISLEQIEAWRTEGIRILAFRRAAGPAQPPSGLSASLETGDSAILAGPEAVIRSQILEPV